MAMFLRLNFSLSKTALRLRLKGQHSSYYLRLRLDHLLLLINDHSSALLHDFVHILPSVGGVCDGVRQDRAVSLVGLHEESSGDLEAVQDGVRLLHGGEGWESVTCEEPGAFCKTIEVVVL